MALLQDYNVYTPLERLIQLQPRARAAIGRRPVAMLQVRPTDGAGANASSMKRAALSSTYSTNPSGGVLAFFVFEAVGASRYRTRYRCRKQNVLRAVSRTGLRTDVPALVERFHRNAFCSFPPAAPRIVRRASAMRPSWPITLPTPSCPWTAQTCTSSEWSTSESTCFRIADVEYRHQPGDILGQPL
jgi:hypothetical protein